MTDLRAVAEAIAAQLFTNGNQDHATRLVLVRDAPGARRRELGGWCEGAAVDHIEAVLREAAAERSGR